MKKIIAIFCSLFIATMAIAQDSDQAEIKKQEFGFHAGITTGTGLSYRFWPGKLGIQLTLLPIKTDDFAWVSVGGSILVNFYEARYVRFFGYIGNHYVFHRYIDHNYFSTADEETVEKEYYNIGFGPGFGFGRRVRFNIMFGYGFYDVLDEFNMYPTGEMGLYFRF